MVFRQVESPIERLMRYVAKTDDGHWMWTGRPNRGGYGLFHMGSRTAGDARIWLAHRAAWTLLRGDIPDGMTLHHICYVRLCVNPDHLEIRTPRDNSLDQSPLRPPRKPKGPHKHRIAVCKNGHPMEGDNIGWTTRSSGEVNRYCRACALASNRRQYAKHIDKRRAYAREKYRRLHN